MNQQHSLQGFLDSKDVYTLNPPKDQSYTHFEICTFNGFWANKLPAEINAKRLKFFEIFCFTKGHGNLIVDLDNYQISNGKIFCLFPGQLRKILPTYDIEGYYISASTDFVYLSQTQSDLLPDKHMFQAQLTPLEITVDEDSVNETNEILLKLMKEFQNYFLQRSEILIGLFKILTIYLSRQCIKREANIPHRRDTLLARDFLSSLQKQYRNKKMVTDYANELCVTPSYLNQVVKKVSGMPASHHIQQQIIIEAKRQAKHFSRSMKEIAYDLGFDDIAHFSKFFKNNCGQNFTDFRKNTC